MNFTAPNDFRIILNQINNISEFDQITYFMNGLNDLTSDYVRLRNPEGNYKNSYTIKRNFKNFKNYFQLPKKPYFISSFYKNKNNAFGDKNFKQKNVLNIHDLGKTNDLFRLFTFINKLKIEAVFDTGATISLMSLELAERLKIMINHSSQKINAADGNTHNVLGKTEPIKIEIGEVIANISFVITNISHVEILLGLDWFEQTKAIRINDLGCCDGVKFEINTSSETPIMSQPLVLIEEMKKEVNKMLNAGIIAPAKAGTWAKVNHITKPFYHPLQRIDDILDKLSKGKIFTHLDLRKGYFQIPVDEMSRHKTGFTVPFGIFEFKRVPFALTNAPAFFSAFMNNILGYLDFVQVYIDDIIIFSKSKEEHLEHLQIVFDILRKNKLKIHPEICVWMQFTVKILGHILDASVIKMDPEKIKVIMEMKPPKTLKQLPSQHNSEDDQIEIQSSGPKTRTRFNLDFKVKVISYYQAGHSINKCSNHFDIDRRIVSSWIRSQTRIKNMKLKRSVFRCKSQKDLASYPLMESQLIDWIKEKRSNGACISGFSIRQKAIELYSRIYSNVDESNVQFKASNGWLVNFCKRKNLVLRRITTSGRELPKNTPTVVKQFFSTCQNIVNLPTYSSNKVINMDESSVYLDFPSNYTYSTKGARRVKANTTGAERARISAGFTPAADGSKFPIFVIVPRKNDLPNFTPPDNVIVVFKSGSTFDKEMICEYMSKVILPYKLVKNLDVIHFVLDSCHKTEIVQGFCEDNGINQVFIPPRLTNLLQPADVCWFTQLKRAYHKKWNNWFLFEDKTFTKNGNARSPGYAKCIEWLSDIWRSMDSDYIPSSFESCGITSQFNLHSNLNFMLKTNCIMNDYIDELNEEDDIDGFEDDQDCVNEGESSPNVDQRTALPSVASSTPVYTSTPSVELSQMSLSNEGINSAQTSNSNTNFSSPSVTSQGSESIQQQISQSSSSNQIINSAQISSLNTNLESSIATPHSSSTHYRQSSLTSSTSSIEIQGRPPLQALPLNINSQTPVISNPWQFFSASITG
ncbi:unnamed protein product [Brachionus calyciflorus]|uniref:HTH CENPB-type domain-containing protein n=1 Tax=Brachionus calyciflorus TaxID=104777 RepID=A0A814IVU6_9BILA|nr:unnamed protein product [Brachionus calyciflorus]